MKRVVVAGLWVALAFGLAAGYPRFETALFETSQQLAQLELELKTAERRAGVLAKDPYASPIERAEAEDALERARARLAQQQQGLRKEAFRLWTDVLKGRAQAEAAEAAERVAKIRLEAARIRAEKGAASRLELDAAERAYEQAALQLAQARATLAEAIEALNARADGEPDEVPPVDLPDTFAAAAHPDLRLARLDVRAAEQALAAAAGPDTARWERERREAALQSARERAMRLEERVTRELDALQARYGRQQRLVELARDALRDARKKLEAEQLRFEEGMTSRLALENARQALAQARVDELAARVELGRLALELWAFAEAP